MDFKVNDVVKNVKTPYVKEYGGNGLVDYGVVVGITHGCNIYVKWDGCTEAYVCLSNEIEKVDERKDHYIKTDMFGSVVKWDYKGFEVSLAMDCSTSCVFDKESNDPLFTADGTSLESVMACKEFIDTL